MKYVFSIIFKPNSFVDYWTTVLWLYSHDWNQPVKREDKGKGVHEPKAQTAGAYPGFLSMKHA